MPIFTISARSAEDAAELGLWEFAFISLRELYDRAGMLEAKLREAGFPFGSLATVSFRGKMKDPNTGDSTELDLDSEPFTVFSVRAVLSVLRTLLRQHMVLPQTGSESGIRRNSQNIYYVANVRLLWETPPPPPPPPPVPPPPPPPKPVERVKAAVSSILKTVKSFFKGLLGR